ncbi:glycosyltransferase family 2 protein [Streptomyces jeddahensis]|uniref:Undecaprenyl-phosphate mannosyltransferase n=1 Tax=Streptomyces jeddahensis TaxID=1716141 RepID=A0A177HYT6_9ACTN|nr:glycosyltransferase family 2 protein [Streptomyces jeddahensis]OAH15880.1 undecaprenyl-phosphate mannosyltransferase [Streptomyces jeddahensis]
MSAFLRPAIPGEDPLTRPSTNGSSAETATVRIPRQYRPVSSHLAIAPPVSVVIPAMNEAENLPHVFKTLPEWIHEVVLVDGNSTDNTVEVARDLWPDVKVVKQLGKGKGDALITGFAACTGDIIVMVDADGSADGQEIVSYVSALVSGADFAKGSRFANGGGTDDMTPIRKLGNWALCAVVNAKFGARYTDLCYGYNAFWRHCLDEIDLDCTGFEVETLMNIRVVKAGLKVQEIPSHEYLRIHGASNLRAVRDGLRVLKVILKERSNRRALRKRAHALRLKARLNTGSGNGLGTGLNSGRSEAS